MNRRNLFKAAIGAFLPCLPEVEAEVIAEGLTGFVHSRTVQVGEKKLTAKWSAGCAQQLESLHGVNAQQALTEIMAQQLQWEIDRQIIEDMPEPKAPVKFISPIEALTK